MKIILASGSPRRKQLMELAGLSCEILISNVDETISGAPEYQVTELSLRKSRATLELLKSREKIAFTDTVIIAADTLVYIDGEVLGKPANAEEAFVMLKNLSGKAHKVYTGVTLLKTDAGGEDEVSTFFDVTSVFFHSLTDEEINAYIQTGEPFDKAGAYGVQEKGAVLVDHVEGDFYTVVGLPISKVYRALKKIKAL